MAAIKEEIDKVQIESVEDASHPTMVDWVEEHSLVFLLVVVWVQVDKVPMVALEQHSVELEEVVVQDQCVNMILMHEQLIWEISICIVQIQLIENAILRK